VHGLIADSPSGAWSTGAAILTFVFPMLLFIAVAAALYVLYTKPGVVPGHQVPSLERPVSYTALPGTPADAARTEGDTGADQTAVTGTDDTAVATAPTQTSAGDATTTGDAPTEDAE
jgi:hypothetical protein